MKFAKNLASYAESGIDTELVLMNVETGQFHALSGVALAIWRLLDKEADPGAITSIVAERCRWTSPLAIWKSIPSSMRWSRLASWSRARQAGG
jgi:hypothetical protein